MCASRSNLAGVACRREHFDGDAIPTRHVLRFEHRALATFAELAAEAVRIEENGPLFDLHPYGVPFAARRTIPNPASKVSRKIFRITAGRLPAARASDARP